jgi:hypothetical protein
VKNIFLIIFVFFSINFTVQANTNNTNFSIKSIIEGTEKSLKEAGKTIYETEFTSKEIWKIVEVTTVFAIRVLLMFLTWEFCLSLFFGIYAYFKYVFFNRTKRSWRDIYDERFVGEADIIVRGISAPIFLYLLLVWYQEDRYPLFLIIQF